MRSTNSAGETRQVLEACWLDGLGPKGSMLNQPWVSTGKSGCPYKGYLIAVVPKILPYIALCNLFFVGMYLSDTRLRVPNFSL